MKYDEAELTNQLLTEFAVDESARSPYESEVLRAYKQYTAYVEELTEEQKERLGGRSRLFIPKTFQQVDTWRARMLKATFNTSPYFDFVPRPVKDSDPQLMMTNSEKAKIPAALVNEQLDKNNIVQVGWDFYTQMAIAKAGILAVGWRYEKKTFKKRRKVGEVIGDNLNKLMLGNVKEVFQKKSWEEIVDVEEVVWDDNEVTNVDWFDCWPDARGRNSNPDTWRHCWIRDWMTREQIENHLAKVKEAGSEVFPITEEEWEQLTNKNTTLDEGRALRLSSVSKHLENDDTATLDRTTDRNKKRILYEVLKYWTGEEYGLIISRYKLACYGSTPYWRHKKIPIVFQPYEPLPGEIQGRSFCDWLYHLQEELNTNRNQRIDNRAININTQWITTDDDLPDVIISRPGRVHRASQKDALVPVPVQDMTMTSVQEEQIIQKDMEDSMGTPAIAMGVDSQRDQTATEITTKNSNASARFDVRINLYQASLKRLCHLMDMNNQQFMTDERLLQIADEEGINQWRQISVDDINGEWDYTPSGVNIDPFANKELRRQQFLKMMEIASKLGLPWDKEIMGDDLLKTFDIRNPMKYKMSPEKMQQQLVARQQAEQEQMQQQALVEAQKQDGKMIGNIIKELVKSNPDILMSLLGMLLGGGQQSAGVPPSPAVGSSQIQNQ